MKKLPLALFPLLALTVLAACSPEGPPTDPVPTAPTDVAVEESDGIVTVSWSHDGTHVTSFRVYRGAVAAPTALNVHSEAPYPQQLELIGEVDSEQRSFEDGTAVVGESYGYEVSAVGPGAGHESDAGMSSFVTVSSGFTAVAGTYIDPLVDSPATTLGFFFRLPPGEIPAGGGTVTVTGPEGWNGDAPMPIGLSAFILGRGWGWTAMPADAIAGSYSVELDLDGVTYESTAVLSAVTTAPYVQGITIESHSASHVDVSWDAGPGAASYQVQLLAMPYEAPSLVASHYVGGTSFNFHSLELAPGYYFIGVVAMPFDAVGTARFRPPGDMSIAYTPSESFGVEAP